MSFNKSPQVTQSSFSINGTLQEIHSDALSAATCYHLGHYFQDRKELEKAFHFFREAVKQEPTLAAAYNELGTICQSQGKIEEAIQWYQKALVHDTKFVEAHYNLGNAFKELGQWPEAFHHSKKAIELNPNLAEAHYNLGIIHYQQDRSEEAILSWQRAIQLKPTHEDAYNNLGAAFQDRHELSKAIACFQKAITCKPDFSEAHWNKALCHLLDGSFIEGWQEYQWRYQIKEIFLNRPFPQPLWDGMDLKGKRILLYAEQGFGDTIQFIRYVPLVTERGGRVMVECQAELASLLAPLEGIEKAIKQGQPLPDFDYQCPLMSLPVIFRTTLSSIPARVPYLPLDPAKVRKWRERLAPDKSILKIGLVWAGRPTHKKDRQRSLSLKAFAPLVKIPGVSYYSLQKGEAGRQIQNKPEGMILIDYTGELTDFIETGALIENLDLIITVDTAVAHLAGALGKSVWNLLPYSPDWRWLLNREDSPWYPTMRLFRQPAAGNWGPVITSVGNCLCNRIDNPVKSPRCRWDGQ